MSFSMEQLVQRLYQIKVVPVISLDQSEDILPLGQTLQENGLPVVEITFRSEAAEKAIYLLKDKNPSILVGAGTVLTTEQVIIAKRAGVDFVVTPGFNPKIIKLCQDLDLNVIPGANNPMAIEAALEMGIDTIKFFPAEASGGVNMIKSLIAPYTQLKIMPTGGINLNNIKDYLNIQNVVACGGSWFVEKSLVTSKNWSQINEMIKEVVSLVQK